VRLPRAVSCFSDARYIPLLASCARYIPLLAVSGRYVSLLVFCVACRRVLLADAWGDCQVCAPWNLAIIAQILREDIAYRVASLLLLTVTYRCSLFRIVARYVPRNLEIIAQILREDSDIVCIQEFWVDNDDMVILPLTLTLYP
jgi:hypothetical protein